MPMIKVPMPRCAVLCAVLLCDIWTDTARRPQTGDSISDFRASSPIAKRNDIIMGCDAAGPPA